MNDGIGVEWDVSSIIGYLNREKPLETSYFKGLNRIRMADDDQ